VYLSIRYMQSGGISSTQRQKTHRIKLVSQDQDVRANNNR
jgi:hypothetical protein